MIMKLFLSLFLILVCAANADLAVLKENVKSATLYSKASKSSKKLLTVNSIEIFDYVDHEHIDKWYYTDVLRNGEWISGYLPNEVMTPIEKLPVYKNKDVSFRYINKPFSKKGKKITYAENGRVLKINGKDPLGSFGGLPKKRNCQDRGSLQRKKTGGPQK